MDEMNFTSVSEWREESGGMFMCDWISAYKRNVELMVNF